MGAGANGQQGRFWWLLVGLVRLRCALCVFALGVVWLWGLIFSLVCAFRGVGCVLVWGLVALRLVGRL